MAQITLNQARNYVIKNGRFMEDAPDDSKYFVKFPTTYSPTTFYAEFVEDLPKKLFNFGKSKKGKSLWENLPKEIKVSYNKVELDYSEDDEDDGGE